jgi:hypothetical protein
MTNIFTNPDLFRAIYEYTNLQSICDTCSLFATLKKYINYKLNREYSLMYYDDVLFRNRVLNKISNPNKQLHLDLSECENITDVSVLANVYDLNLSYCNNITDVSALGNVHILDLRECNQLTDVSASNVHTLDLRECNQLTDVTALRNVNKLILP